MNTSAACIPLEKYSAIMCKSILEHILLDKVNYIELRLQNMEPAWPLKNFEKEIILEISFLKTLFLILH